ncbi:MAG: response regulator transcription factor [Bacteroidota bacterium]
MKKTKVLYVEDEPFLAKIVKESLESRAYDVNLVEDGLLVLPAFEQYRPDICILDVMLPNKDGFSLGKEIRKKAPQLPIIYLTAKNQTQDLLNGFQSGGNDYIKKPFSMEELIVRIENLLALTNADGRQKTASSDEVSIGQFVFYPKKYELHFGDAIRKLSHRDTQLLHILSSKRNTAVQRKDILREVWGDDSFFNSRNLDVYIAKLRDYLKADPEVRIITLKGVGYHFSVG